MIIITGMHRSGTSLIAEILFRLGIDFGDPSGFYPADPWNPRGYFEQQDIMDLNSRLICGFPRSGGSLSRKLGQIIYLTMPGPKRIAESAEKYSPEICRMGKKYQGKAVKDPRFCLTLDQWGRFAQIRSVITCLRGPRQTVLSLYRRQSIPLPIGYRFWNYHMGGLLGSLAGKPHLLVDYDCLADPEKFRDELRVIREILPPETSPQDIEGQYRAVFERDLRHFAPQPEDALPAATKRIWDSFISLRAEQAKRLSMPA